MSARGLFHLSKRASVQRDQPAPPMLYEEHIYSKLIAS